MTKKSNSYELDLQKDLKDPEFKKYFNEYGKQLEAAYRVLNLRKKKKMSQQTLAKKLGTSQAAVARMEAGNQNFSLKMLGKIADVFGKELKISFE
ncbi:helix-turn-helix transcriptional regulator [Candidatus Parcubacteria bacterium]|nr:helix-turn-helix transcriptional regulator [Candidatus Parcubacteria bacterium]